MVGRRDAKVFNTIYDVYDNAIFLRRMAERLVELVKIAPGWSVLDVCCGTGSASLPAALAAGKTGHVTGIDIAEKMLDVAGSRSRLAGLTNLEYRLGNAEKLDFPDGSFDAVICASSLHFFQDTPAVLGEWKRVLKPGGTIAFSSFESGLLQPLARLFSECLAVYNIQMPPYMVNGDRTDTPDKCRELLKMTGFLDANIYTEQLGYFLNREDDHWREISSTLTRLHLNRLDPIQMAAFKNGYLAKTRELFTDKGIWLDIPAIFGIATKNS
jgi:arsenite methyltransferase